MGGKTYLVHDRSELDQIGMSHLRHLRARQWYQVKEEDWTLDISGRTPPSGIRWINWATNGDVAVTSLLGEDDRRPPKWQQGSTENDFQERENVF